MSASRVLIVLIRNHTSFLWGERTCPRSPSHGVRLGEAIQAVGPFQHWYESTASWLQQMLKTLCKMITCPASLQWLSHSLKENATKKSKNNLGVFFFPSCFLKLWIYCTFLMFSRFFSGKVRKWYYKSTYLVLLVSQQTKAEQCSVNPAWKHPAAASWLSVLNLNLLMESTPPWLLHPPHTLCSFCSTSLWLLPSDHQQCLCLTTCGFRPSSCL